MNNSIAIIRLNKNEIKELIIKYFFYETEYAPALIASSPKGVCYIGFGEKEFMLRDFKKRYAGAIFQEEKAEMHNLALNYIRHEKVAELPLHISGTDFQLDVWKALIQIPIGNMSSYQDVAKAAKRPKAVRATGSAVGSNPVSCIIPCHRVIRSDGGLGGYFWGLDIKKKMLDAESRSRA